ncbi:MAG: TIGR03032 family protein [Lysobacterales bacterium]
MKDQDRDNDPSPAATPAPVENAPFDFSSAYSANLPKLLKALNVSVLMTSYQASRLIAVRSDGECIDTDLKAFPRPMGLAVRPDRLVLGIWAQVLDYRRSRTDLVVELPDNPADALFVPRASHVSGMINVHDIAWGEGGLWAVNSTFSCLCSFHPDSSFVPRWQPHFISALVPEDRCHLNGMAMRDGLPAYVTTFGKFDRPRAWREWTEFDGSLMEVADNRVLLDGLVMPHSPRWHRDEVYFCESGRGLVRAFNPATGACRTVVELPGFTRGLAFAGPLMLVGLSRARVSEAALPPPISSTATVCGLRVVDLDNGALVAHMDFTGDVTQIYDVAVLNGSTWPEILDWSDERVGSLYTL